MLGGELIPNGIQKFQILFFGNSSDKSKAHLTLAAIVTKLFPSALAAHIGRELFQREPAGENLHLVGRDFQILF